MKSKKALAVVAGAALLLLFVVLVTRAARSGDEPAVKPQELASIFEEIASLDAGSKPPKNPFDKGTRNVVPVSRRGNVLTVGLHTIDLGEPKEEFKKLINIFRHAFAAYRANERDARALTALRQAYTALAEMIKILPELGMELYNAIITDNDAQTGLTLGKLLKLSNSQELYNALLAVLESGGPTAHQYLAVGGLEHRHQAPANKAILAAWNREAEPMFRQRAIDVLSRNLVRTAVSPEVKQEALSTFRESARTTDDPARRVEALRGLVESQEGNVTMADRTLINDLIKQEENPSRKAELSRVRSRLTDKFRAMKPSQ